MKINTWYVVALVPVALMASSGPMGAQIAILGVTVGIFLGTLGLRRPEAQDATTTHH